jgi:hypothetical protein
MKTSPTLLSLLFVTACIPSMPGSWSGSPPPLPPPPPAAESALDDEDGDRGDRSERDERTARDDRREKNSENRGGGGGGSSGGSSRSEFPQPSARQLKELRAALEDMPRGERVNRLYDLIDPFYFTVEQLAVLVEEIPNFDRVKAIDIAACSVLDPENAGRITDAVVHSDKSKAISALKKQCYRKNNWDKRPPGKMSHKAAPPPGAYLLPSER